MRFRAVFRFGAGENFDQWRKLLAILLVALRELRKHDPDAELQVVPDEGNGTKPKQGEPL